MDEIDHSTTISPDQWAQLERIKARVAPGRSCGTCSLCCKVVTVPAVDSAAGTWCRHASPGHGCTIYDKRPFLCRSAYCEWMMNPAMGPEWKPEIAKFVIYQSEGGKRVSIHVDPGARDAWRRAPYYENIKRWAAEAARKMPDPHMVDVMVGEHTTVILPDGEVDLGVLAADEQIRIARTVAGKLQVDKVKRAA
jgi:hypothetical protein